jgi:hypothetical protein
MLDKAGAPDIYKRFRIMDALFMFCMYIQNEVYNNNAFHHMVTNKACLIIPFPQQNIRSSPQTQQPLGALFICPADRHITVIDYLYDHGKWYVTIFDNLARFINEYKR